MREQLFAKTYPLTARIARFHAVAAVASYSLPKDFRSDLIQEGVLELWHKRIRFDENRGCWQTFSEHVIANRIRSIIRSYRCGSKRELSLFARVQAPRAQHPQIDFSLDVQTVLATLSSFDRHVAHLLCDHTPVEISRVLRVSRSTLYLAINRLRDALRDVQAGHGIESSRTNRQGFVYMASKESVRRTSPLRTSRTARIGQP
jgi:RNA polymerase sigma factor (sigma-70 family)